MAELKRSVTSYRRTGSSGMVWNDKHVSGLFRDPNQTNANNQAGDDQHQRVEPRSLRQAKSVGAAADLAVSRSQSTGATVYRKVKAAPPSKDPPPPKLSTCGFFCFPVVTTQHLYCKSKKRR